MADYIEGKRPVIEAFRTGVPMRRILMGDYMKRDPKIGRASCRERVFWVV